MLLSAVDVAVNVAIARRLYRRRPCRHRHRTINVSISVSFAVAIAVAVAVAITLSNAVAVAVAVAIAIAIAIAIAVLIAITIAVTIADAVTVTVTVAIAIIDASSSHRIHFPSSASPLVASTSFQPPIVSWRLLSFAGRLIVTSLRSLRCPICHHRRSSSPLPPTARFEAMQYFDGNKDKKLTWLALLFGNDKDKGLTGGGKADSTDNACHCQKELFSEL